MILEKDTQCKVFYDYENDVEEWWDGGGRWLLDRFFGGKLCSSQAASGEEVMALVAEAEKIPGWGEGPECAKYPFFIFVNWVD